MLIIEGNVGMMRWSQSTHQIRHTLLRKSVSRLIVIVIKDVLIKYKTKRLIILFSYCLKILLNIRRCSVTKLIIREPTLGPIR